MDNSELHSLQLLGTVTVGPKGQVVIPAEARAKMEVQPGDKLVAFYIGKRRTVALMPESQVQELIEKLGQHIQLLQTI